MVLSHHSLTCTLRLFPGNPWFFPASLWTLLEMAPFGCWGLPVALLTLLCCPGEPVPGVTDVAGTSLGGGGGAGPKVSKALKTVATCHGYCASLPSP